MVVKNGLLKPSQPKTAAPETAPALERGPLKQELATFSRLLTRHSMIHEDMRRFFDGYPMTAHPMAILSAMVSSLSSRHSSVPPANATLRPCCPAISTASLMR